MADTPHFAVPFQIAGRSATVVDQDSDPDILGCVSTLIRTEIGSRDELPEYGIEDPAFRTTGEVTTEITDAVREWEPRVSTETTAEIEELIMRVKVDVT